MFGGYPKTKQTGFERNLQFFILCFCRKAKPKREISEELLIFDSNVSEKVTILDPNMLPECFLPKRRFSW